MSSLSWHMNLFIMFLVSVKRLWKALRFRGSICTIVCILHITSVMRVDKLLLLIFGSSISYFQWSISVKGFKIFWWLIKWLHIGSTNYVNTLCGQPISLLVLRYFYWRIFINKKLVFWLSFKVLLTYHFLSIVSLYILNMQHTISWILRLAPLMLNAYLV